MKNCVCNISLKNGIKGSGFFCKIPLDYNSYLPVLITNNHIIDENYINNEKYIYIQLNDNIINKSITLKNKFIFTDRKYDITIIEIKEFIDNISAYNFLELDENILNDPIIYVGNSIYIIQYPGADKVAVSYGILKKLMIVENIILSIIVRLIMALLDHQ